MGGKVRGQWRGGRERERTTIRIGPCRKFLATPLNSGYITARLSLATELVVVMSAVYIAMHIVLHLCMLRSVHCNLLMFVSFMLTTPPLRAPRTNVLRLID